MDKTGCPYLGRLMKARAVNVCPVLSQSNFDISKYLSTFPLHTTSKTLKCPLDTEENRSNGRFPTVSKKRPIGNSNLCVSCQQTIGDDDIRVVLNELSYHKSCFISETSQEPWFREPKCPFLESKRHKLPETSALVEQVGVIDITRSLKVSVSTQPAKYQIANYNIYPSPVLNIDIPLPKNQTISARLVESSQNLVISMGFKSGDVQNVLPGVKMVQFSGLKLNKISIIKSRLPYPVRNRIKECKFLIQFSIGSATWDSEPFNVVSSFGQLPLDHQEERPFKKPASHESDDEGEDDHEDGEEKGGKCSIDFLVNPVDTPVQANTTEWKTK